MVANKSRGSRDVTQRIMPPKCSGKIGVPHFHHTKAASATCGCEATRPMPSFSAVAAAPPARSPIFPARERLVGRAWRERRLSSSATRLALAADGPSCLFVGPVETASQERLEALYRQARDSYYSGKPLIVDDMFDKVELKLRLYGSKSVVKYPRCSLRRQSTYADAEEDPSQVFTLAGVWILLLAFGISAFLLPSFYTISLTFKDATEIRHLFSSGRSPFELLTTANGILFTGFGVLIGYPVASAAVQALRGLWRNDLVALKGSCPSCGEEVFAFVRAENSNILRHSTECHVCECALEFRTKVEQSISETGRRWVYGRIYLVRGSYLKKKK